jgi:hypothetical protein
MLKLDRSSKHGLLCFGDNTFLSYYHDLPVNINNGFVISQPETSLSSLPASAKPMTLRVFMTGAGTDTDAGAESQAQAQAQTQALAEVRPTATASTRVAQPRPTAELQVRSHWQVHGAKQVQSTGARSTLPRNTILVPVPVSGLPLWNHTQVCPKPSGFRPHANLVPINVYSVIYFALPCTMFSLWIR